MSEELKPCPFCGAKAKLLGGRMSQEEYSIWCTNLHHLDGGMDRQKIITAWNTRAPINQSGYAVVPVEPTEAMVRRSRFLGLGLAPWEIRKLWRDMIAAAKGETE